MEPHLGPTTSTARSPGPRTSPGPPARSPPSSTAKESTTHEPQKLRFALVGAGVIGRRPRAGRWPAWTSPSSSRSSTPTRPRHRRWPTGTASEATTDLDAVLRRDDVDAVSDLHAQRPARRRRRGGPGRRQARRRREAHRHHPGRGRPDHRRREALRQDRRGDLPAPVRPVHRKVLQAVRDGHLGPITSAIASHAWWRGQCYYDSGDWRGTWALDGGGAVMNQAVHTVNLLITIAGHPGRGVRLHRLPRPRAHRGRGHRRRGREVRLRRAGHDPRHHRRLPRASTPACASSARRARPSSPTTSWRSSTRTPVSAPEIGMQAPDRGRTRSPTTTRWSRRTARSAARTAASSPTSSTPSPPAAAPRVGTAEARTVAVGDPRDVRVGRVRPARHAVRSRR